ncbi:hypothetical protein HK405_008028, partial [Cladochytrium tenue]
DSSEPSTGPGATGADQAASGAGGDERARNYVCTTCNKTFLRNQDLLRHGATHMDPSERPHLCPNGCGRPFGRADAAYRHSKTSCKLIKTEDQQQHRLQQQQHHQAQPGPGLVGVFKEEPDHFVPAEAATKRLKIS